MHGVRVGVVACLLFLLAACGGEGSGERPTPSATASVTRTATRTPSVPSPTRSLGDRESPTPTASSPAVTSAPSSPSSSPTAAASPTSSRSAGRETESPTASPTESSESPTESSTSPTESASPTPSATADASEGAEGTPTESSDVPAWVWWLLALLLVAGAVSIPLAVRARRRNAWLADLSASQAEVAWFARVLIPQVLGAGSPEAAAGVWRVAGEARVTEVEDRLTALGASAPDEASSGRALVLRDTVRAARARMATVVTTSTDQALARDLDEVAAQLEVALPPAEPPSA